MKTVATICRLLFGFLFLLSGFVKGVDPLGSEYKFLEYFNAFGFHGVSPIALILSFSLSALEFLIGCALIMTIQIRLVAFLALVFMVIVTPLTLIIAILNPVADCGCFGDAFIISNWTTFLKNIILLAMVIMIFHYRNRYKSSFNVMEQTGGFLLIIGGFFTLQLYCYNHLPIIDFRPYYIGANLNSNGNSNGFQEQILLQYRNRINNEVSVFTEENYPWQDTLNWEYVSTSTQQIRPTSQDHKMNFYVEHPQFGVISGTIAKDPNYTVLCVADNLNKMNTENLDRLKELIAAVHAKGYQFYFLTASPLEDIHEFQERHKISGEFAIMDEIELKTMIRSNPGILLIKDGIILNKWSHKDIPSEAEFEQFSPLAENVTKLHQTGVTYRIISAVLFIILLLVAYLCRKHKCRARTRF